MRSITVAYPIAQQAFASVTVAEYDLIYSLYSQERKILAIKFLRQQYGYELRMSKDICDAIAAKPRCDY